MVIFPLPSTAFTTSMLLRCALALLGVAALAHGAALSIDAVEVESLGFTLTTEYITRFDIRCKNNLLTTSAWNTVASTVKMVGSTYSNLGRIVTTSGGLFQVSSGGWEECEFRATIAGVDYTGSSGCRNTYATLSAYSMKCTWSYSRYKVSVSVTIDDVPNGNVCFKSAQCLSGTCKGSNCCKSTLSSGCTACDSDGDCETQSCSSGYYWDSWDCYTLKSLGTLCTGSNECGSGLCRGRCCSSSVASTCTSCSSSGTCTSGASAGIAGSSCSSSSSCSSNRCQGGKCCKTSISSACTSCDGDGDCATNSCASGYYWADWNCLQIKTSGSTCQGSNECSSGLCRSKCCSAGASSSCSTCGTSGSCLDVAPPGPPPVQQCAPGCPSSWLKDNYCDSACNNAACNFDSGDCTAPCAPNCQASWLGDRMCDRYCNNAACNYDGGDCEVQCAPGCKGGWPGDRICDSACNNAACNFDNGDCAAPRPPPAANTYNINLKSDVTNQAVLNAVSSSLARWESVIRQGLPPLTASPATIRTNCNQGGISGIQFSSSDFGDMMIFLTLTTLRDINTLGQAAACHFQGDMPRVGFIQLNSAVVDRMVAEGNLQSVLMHEIGHIFGINRSVWGRKGLARNIDSADPRYTGAGGKASWGVLRERERERERREREEREKRERERDCSRRELTLMHEIPRTVWPCDTRWIWRACD
jgi:hypothetical protein